jgi:TonB-linked SusC/RagA family outer membrane protein
MKLLSRGCWRSHLPAQLLLIMRITTALLFITALHVSATGRSQTVSYSGKNVRLEQVFAAIEQQTGYGFFYKLPDLESARPVTVELKNTPLSDALEKILENQSLNFSIQGNTVVITQKHLSTPDLSQGVISSPSEKLPIDIHGRVTDSLGNPLAGVSVSVKGGKIGTSTDANGNFTLYGVSENATIIISNVGYEEQVIKLKGKNQIAISLKSHLTSLSEVIINKGYYNTTARLNTGDVTVVSGADINKQPVTDPILALEGRVPGLNIQQTSGVPGAYSSINIRGQNSIANGNDPLYVIDGVPYSSLTLTNSYIGGGAVGGPRASFYNYNNNGQGMSPFNFLNPADIDNIEVLKDADATAIYGSRGANGVILITTKKGKAGKTKFDLNVFTGGGKVTREVKLLNTSQYLEMRREAFANDGLPFPSIITNPQDNNYDVDGVWDTTRYTNWQKVLIGNTASFTNAQGSLSGGNTNTQFVLGAGFSRQGTVYQGDFSDQKTSVHVNLTHASEDQRFQAQFTANYVNDNSKVPSIDFATNQITIAPDAPALYSPNGNLNFQDLNGSYTFLNPLSNTFIKALATTFNLISDLKLAYKILPGLQIKSDFGYTHSQMNQSIFLPAQTAFPPPYNLPLYSSNSLATSDFKTWIIEPMIDYKGRISRGQLEALIGSTFQENNQTGSSELASQFPNDALIPNPTAASSFQLGPTNNTLYHYDALYGRINYNWDEKYLINVTGRRDGSSRFGPSKKFGNFGAIGAAWIFSKETFIQNALPFLSFGKLRASYGTTGNDQIQDYQYLSTYTPASPTYQGITGLSPTQLSNPYFAWEVDKKLEGGIELGFLKDRLFFTGSFYRNRTGNQLVGYPLPGLTGFNSIESNLPAVVQNTGIELTANIINIKFKDFVWTTTANLTIPKNKLVSFPNLSTSPAYSNSLVVGQPLYIQHVYHFTGVNPQTGLYSFATKNASGLPSSPQDYITRSVTQNYYGGIENRFSYKGFDLDFLFQYVNQLKQSYLDYVLSPGIVNNNEPTAVLSRWQSPGDLANIQRFGQTGATAGIFNAYFQRSDATIVSGSFLRLKNLALSYQIPVKWKKGMVLQNARIYVQCQNLFTVTHYIGSDPESGGLSLPPLRMITTGLQIGL